MKDAQSTDPLSRPPIVPISGRRRSSLTGRIVSRSVAVGTVLVLSVSLVNYLLSLRQLSHIVHEVARDTVDSTVARVERVFGRAAANTQTLAIEVVRPGISADEIKTSIKDSMRPFVEIDAEIYGMAVGVEPHVLAPELDQFCPYFYRPDETIVYSDLATGSYDYLKWDWYTEPKRTSEPRWSRPYYDQGGGNILMTTYSVPIKADDGRFAGVATTDISLEFLRKLVREIQVGQLGSVLILSADWRIVAHQQPEMQMSHASLPHPAAPQTGPSDELEQQGSAFWKEQLSGLPADQAAELHLPCFQMEGSCWVSVQPLLDTDWRVLVMVPERALESRVMRLIAEISLFALAGLIALIVVVTEMTRNLMSPLAQLVDVTKEIGSGNLDVELPELHTRDEIGELTTSFGTMRDSLKTHIVDLAEATAREHRLESEIEIARGIQMSMVPGHGLASARGDTWEVFASLRPARTIGGDLYYFSEDDGKLQFILGDVSDKGVPAALVMAKTVTVYAGAIEEEPRPGEALERLNTVVARDNDTCMFVTALCGVLDLADGTLMMANAGHMNPVRLTAASCGPIEIDGGPALGIVPDADYPNVRLELEPGTCLILYTDGISEAFDETGEEFGLERIVSSIESRSELSAEQLGREVLSAVDRFATTDGIFDDSTLLIIRYA